MPTESRRPGHLAALSWDVRADVAQLVEHFTRNEGVRGSNPRVGSPKFLTEKLDLQLFTVNSCGDDLFGADRFDDTGFAILAHGWRTRRLPIAGPSPRPSLHSQRQRPSAPRALAQTDPRPRADLLLLAPPSASNHGDTHGHLLPSSSSTPRAPASPRRCEGEVRLRRLTGSLLRH
jgi:hypothetical protein